MRRWVHPAWKVLGIEPTSDTRAIRTAYSARLKAIDPETDPKAFIALREAFEAAKIQAQWVDQADQDEDDEDLWDEEEDGESWTPAGDLYQIRPSGHVPTPPPPDPAWETPAPPEPPEPFESAEPADSYWQSFAPPERAERPSPWAPISPEDADAHSRALATLLYSQDREADPWATPAQEEEMLAHWRAIVADPRMQELSYFADAERWFSELIARTAAFSDPLVIPATEYFGWLKADGSITQTHAIAWLTRRYRMLEFQQSVKQPKHPLYPAWRELVRPSGPNPRPRPRRGSVNGRKVRQLLRIVRSRYPDLEGCFDPHRAALWDGTHVSSGGGQRRPFFDWGCLWIPALIFIGLVVIVAIGDKHLPHPRPIASELEHTRPDIDVALEKLFGDRLDIASVETENPALAKALIVFWTEERERLATRDAFARDLETFLGRWYSNGVRKGSADLLAEHHQLVIDMVRQLLARDPAACQRLLAGSRRWDPAFHLPLELRDREKTIEARVLLETDGAEPAEKPRARFSIPGEIVAAATRRARVSDKVMEQALLFEGAPAQICASRIAFMETVLALPTGKQRTELMRHM